MSLAPTLLDHFKHPRNSGRLDAPTGRASADNPSCGDLVTIEARVVDGRLEAARFLARGCSSTIACASFVIEHAIGLSVADIAALDTATLWLATGERSEARRHGVALSLDALQRAVKGMP